MKKIRNFFLSLSVVIAISGCGIADHLNYAVIFEGEDFGETFIVRADHLPIAGFEIEDSVRLGLLRAAYVTKEKGFKYFYVTDAWLKTNYYVIDLILPSDFKKREIRLHATVTNENQPYRENFFEAEKIINSEKFQALR